MAGSALKSGINLEPKVVSEKEFLSFLSEARSKGSFEAGAPRKKLQGRMLQIGPFFTPDNPVLSYLDTWKNNKEGFTGETETMSNGVTIWRSTYDAKILSARYKSGELKDALSDVLKTALRSTPVPYRRGPDRVTVGEYTYESSFVGDLYRFIGSEKVFRGKKAIFSLIYGGGTT